jgi:hydrogenase maturation factor
MNILRGEIDEIYVESGSAMAKVRVHAAFLRVPLTLVVDANVGDTILIESGVAIAKVESAYPQKEQRRN